MCVWVDVSRDACQVYVAVHSVSLPVQVCYIKWKYSSTLRGGTVVCFTLKRKSKNLHFSFFPTGLHLLRKNKLLSHYVHLLLLVYF